MWQQQWHLFHLCFIGLCHWLINCYSLDVFRVYLYLAHNAFYKKKVIFYLNIFFVSFNWLFLPKMLNTVPHFFLWTVMHMWYNNYTNGKQLSLRKNMSVVKYVCVYILSLSVCAEHNPWCVVLWDTFKYATLWMWGTLVYSLCLGSDWRILRKDYHSIR